MDETEQTTPDTPPEARRWVATCTVCGTNNRLYGGGVCVEGEALLDTCNTCQTAQELICRTVWAI